MHNLKDLRKNLEIFNKKFKNKNLDFNIDIFTKADKANRELINKKELLEQEKKKLSKSKEKSNFEKSKKTSKKITNNSYEKINAQKKLNDLLFLLPNLALDDVPVGKDETANQIIKSFGNKKNFSFVPKSHTEIGSKDNGIDFDTSIKLSGSRFVVLKDNFALLERALINFMLDVHTLGLIILRFTTLL